MLCRCFNGYIYTYVLPLVCDYFSLKILSNRTFICFRVIKISQISAVYGKYTHIRKADMAVELGLFSFNYYDLAR